MSISDIQNKIDSIPEPESASILRRKGKNLVSAAQLGKYQIEGGNYPGKKLVSIVQGQNKASECKSKKKVNIVTENTTPLYRKKQQICFSLQTTPLSHTQFL